MFYNPMWRFLGDRKQPYGTYYHNNSNSINTYWNLYDQVIIRPALRERFVDDSLKIATETQSKYLLDANGHPDKEVDIQNDLGKIGQETHKFECYLYTPGYDKYKYRVFFVKYDISNYPVNIILEESVTRSISSGSSGYVLSCATREELEELMYKIFNSKKLISVMQELIRINQSKKSSNNTNISNNQVEEIE